MRIKTMIIGMICLGGTAFAESPVDDFGFQKFYPTLTGSLFWTSAHWNNGNPYYKYVSIREIDPTGNFDDTGIRPRAKPLLKNVPVRHFDLLGRSQVLEKF